MRCCDIKAWYKSLKEKIMISTFHATASGFSMAPKYPRTRLLLATVLACAGLAATCVSAQTVYRSVDANGRVTFSDLPPNNAKQVTPVGMDRDGTTPNVSLPFELRSVVDKYPVTLYTSADCAPCDDGRALLRTRGVPFAEKTVSKPEDVESLKRLSNATSLPLLTVGSHQLKGFSSGEWTQYLGLAGYPETSQLPAAYRNPPPTPLVAVQTPVNPAASASAPTAATPVTPVPPAPPNPAGIRF